MNYDKPTDVVPIAGFATFMANAKLWATSRGLDKATYHEGALRHNIATEILEGAEALVEITKASLPNAEPIADEDMLKLYGMKADAFADALIFLAVDSHKIGFPEAEVCDDDISGHTMPERSAVLNPISDFWFVYRNVFLYYLCTCREILLLGFDPEEVLEEVFRELTTRRGKYDEDIGKWVKEPMNTIYKADFTHCLVDTEDLNYRRLVSRFNGFNTD